MSNKKVIILIVLFVLIAGALIFYILYGGTNTEEIDTPQASVSEIEAGLPASQIISDQEAFSKFNASLGQNGLTAELDGEVTIFAPNNQAFEDLPQTDKLTENLDKNITGYHIVRGVFTTADLTDGLKLPTLSGQELVVLVEEDNTYILDAKGNKISILTADITTASGVIHETNQLFLLQ